MSFRIWVFGWTAIAIGCIIAGACGAGFGGGGCWFCVIAADDVFTVEDATLADVV